VSTRAQARHETMPRTLSAVGAGEKLTLLDRHSPPLDLRSRRRAARSRNFVGDGTRSRRTGCNPRRGSIEIRPAAICHREQAKAGGPGACREPPFSSRNAQRNASALIRQLMAMLRTNSWILILGLIAATAGVRSEAQATRQEPGGNSGKVVHAVDPLSGLPFALDATAPGGADRLDFRAVQAMTPEDRRVVSNAWGTVEKKAAENGFDIGRKGWTYEQVVSSVFREHVLLLFLQDGSYGERSEFSAIVPRQGAEPLHVIPILRRGYSPYSASQESPLTMAAFNQALASERAHEKPYWLSVLACYAALNGSHAVLPPVQTDKGGDGPADWVATPSLHAEDDGGALARFETEEAPGRFTAWQLTFDKNGNVIRAVTSRVKPPTVRVVKTVQ
jgi:hypothetical protein